MMISLPANWVRQNNLDKGDEIDIEQADKDLIISTEVKKGEKKQITIQINNENKQDIKNILTHVYRKGFDKIIIKGINSDILKEIRNTTNQLLLGFELTQRNKNQYIIENISEPTEQKYELILQRIFSVIKETQDLIVQDFEQGKFQNIKEIEEIRNQQDKFILFCRRLLVKEKLEKNTVLQWELLTFLMHIQHNYYYLYKYAEKNKIKNKKITEMLSKLKEYFELFEQAFDKKSIAFIHKINTLKQEYQFGKCLVLIEKSKNKEAIVFSYIRELFRLVQIGTSPLLAELLEKQLKD